MHASLKDIHGVLLFDKPQGLSSNDALQKVKRLFGAKKAGHTGTLDPLATGLLPICFGEATKFSRFLLDADKHYETVALLGVETDTGDKEGRILKETAVPPFTLADIETVLEKFRGEITQIPSMFSAIKYQGKPLYTFARAGIEVPRVSRTITIQSLQLIKFSDNQLHLSVKATKGTYIRTLVEDIGHQLGCGAHVVALRRLSTGPFDRPRLFSWQLLEQLLETEGKDGLVKYLLPVSCMLDFMPKLAVSSSELSYLYYGQSIPLRQISVALEPGTWVQLIAPNGDFFGVGEVLEDAKIVPRRLTHKEVPLLAKMG